VVSGALKCWGANTYGQLGDGTTTERHLPVTVSGITNAIQISTSPEAHSCATLQDGTAKCWGYNGSYQLGDGTNTNSLVPVTVSGATGIKKITAGRHHTCALIGSGAKAGTVSCWGDNSYGQLGSPSTGVYPATVDIVSNATDLASGMYQNCVMLADQSVQCWGRNESGQVGVGSFVSPILTATTISGI
jgi:alpha-tubulin suppressor-like RCC1 family protein